MNLNSSFWSSNPFKLGVTSLFILCILLLGMYNFLPKSQGTATGSKGFQVIGWGNNTVGQLGDTSYGQENLPIRVLTDKKAVQVAAGNDFSLIRTDDGKVLTAGGKVTSIDSSGKRVSQGRDWRVITTDQGDIPFITYIDARRNNSLLIDTNGEFWTWGDNHSTQQGDFEEKVTTTPQKKTGFQKSDHFAVGYRFVTAIKDKTLYVLGANCSVDEVIEAEENLKKMGNALQNLGGYFDPFSDTDKGTYGTLQNDCLNQTTVGFNAAVPVAIPDMKNLLSVSAGYGHILGLTNDGTVQAFGCNLFGQVGLGYKGNTAENRTPQTIKNLQNIIQVAAGFRHSLALDRDGNVWAWGLNARGQLGDGTTEDRTLPTKVQIENVSKIYAGHDVSYAITKDGSLWGWGENHGGMFANNKNEEYIKPVRISDQYNFIDLAIGLEHVVAIVE